MKYTIEQLQKIDFGKCKLKDLQTVPLKVNLSRFSVDIVSGATGLLLLQCELDGEWNTKDGCWYANKNWFDGIFQRADEVDAFIERELNRIIADETKPEAGDGYELCDKNDATEYNYWCAGDDFGKGAWSCWDLIRYCANYPHTPYIFRRPVKVAEPEVGDGFEFCSKDDATEVCTVGLKGYNNGVWMAKCLFNFKQGYKFYRFRRPIQKSHHTDLPDVGEGFELCTKENATDACINISETHTPSWGPWMNISFFMFRGNPDCYRFRRPIPKPSPITIEEMLRRGVTFNGDYVFDCVRWCINSDIHSSIEFV